MTKIERRFLKKVRKGLSREAGRNVSLRETLRILKKDVIDKNR